MSVVGIGTRSTSCWVGSYVDSHRSIRSTAKRSREKTVKHSSWGGAALRKQGEMRREPSEHSSQTQHFPLPNLLPEGARKQEYLQYPVRIPEACSPVSPWEPSVTESCRWSWRRRRRLSAGWQTAEPEAAHDSPTWRWCYPGQRGTRWCRWWAPGPAEHPAGWARSPGIRSGLSHSGSWSRRAGRRDESGRKTNKSSFLVQIPAFPAAFIRPSLKACFQKSQWGDVLIRMEETGGKRTIWWSLRAGTPSCGRRPPGWRGQPTESSAPQRTAARRTRPSPHPPHTPAGRCSVTVWEMHRSGWGWGWGSHGTSPRH